MNCPYCGKEMDLYEHWTDWIDDDTMDIEEHWSCNDCSKTFSRDVFYRVIKRGELNEQ